MTDETRHKTDDHPSRFSRWLENVLDDTEEMGSTNGRNLLGLPTGFRDLDHLTSGLVPGTLTVIASRPGMGRTTLVSDICRHTAIANGLPAFAWTLEETAEEFAARVLYAESRVARHHARAGLMQDADWTRMAQRMPDIVSAPLYINAPASLTAAELEVAATEAVEEHGAQLIVVDGIQDIRPEKRSDLREREVGDVVRDLKTLARTLDVPVLATSHLNRSPEQRIDKKPRLDDLRESGAITFAADTIILLHREDYYELESPRAGEADLIVAKHRQGPTALITVAFQGHYGRFVDMAPDYRPEPPASPSFDITDMFGTKGEG